MNYRHDLRNIAIIAHVDHGKTTLVDGLLKQSKVFRENQQMGECIMDLNALERERGITILAKNTAVTYKGVKINIIDTPGHADFGGEVERVINMADGCLLLIDAVDGPMPQTKVVLRKALEKKLKPIVVINKIDRENARVNEVVSLVQDLFLELATSADQLDYPVIYASGREGWAVTDANVHGSDLIPLFEAILKEVPPPVIEEGPFQMLVSNLDYDTHKGKIAIGRIWRGKVSPHDQLLVMNADGSNTPFEVKEVFTHLGLKRIEVEEVEAGDIIAITGMDTVTIGDTLASPDRLEALPRIEITEPTVKMTFGVNTSPFSGREGKYSTTRQLRERLYRELETNLSLRVQDTDTPDTFLVSGRGELHLSILIETMRREGYEFEVSKPEAIIKEVDGKLLEPVESLTLDIREEFIGVLTELLSSRQSQMTNMHNDGRGNIRMEFRIPTKGLIGFRSAFLTATRGEGVMNSIFLGFEPWIGELDSSRSGSVMVASETGEAVPYGLNNAQQRGIPFIDPGTQVYEGMIIGQTNRPRDITVNVCKAKKLTNIRSSTSDIAVKLIPPIKMSLEQSIDFVNKDELVEVTPKEPDIASRAQRSLPIVALSIIAVLLALGLNIGLRVYLGAQTRSTVAQIIHRTGLTGNAAVQETGVTMLKYVFAVLVVALTWAVVIVLGLPLWVGIVATLATILGLVGLILFRQWQARRAARALEAEIEAQGQEHARNVRPELQAEIQAMQQEFTKAVASLKSSRLGRSGAAALYALPWYVLIGPPGAGKTTALRNSGLQFPYLSAKGGGVRGVGGTRNCEWWFTNDAVILDTAGRYATRDDDRNEWLSFLQMVKQHRPRRPINGIIVGVPVGDVVGAGEEEIAALAKRLRERIDEVMGRLQMVVPVYMMFTKCDLVPGFVEIFGSLRKTERGQILGFTLPLGRASSPPGDLFAANFDELHRTIEQYALRRMGEERKIETRELIHGFPQQFGVLRDDLALFMGTLFQDNVYQDAPILRGAYFSSGTQEGSPINRMMVGMARAFGLPPRTMLAEPTVEAKSYFLREIFASVVFPDHDSAVRSAEAVRQERGRRLAIAAGAFGCAALLSVLPAYAFVRNLGLVKSTRGIVEALRKPRPDRQVIAPERLAPLRQRVDELHAYEEAGPPLAMRFGMYAGGELYPPLHNYYTNVLRQELLEPIVRSDIQDLGSFAQQYADPSIRPTSEVHGRYFNKLKMHLLMTTPRAAGEPELGERERKWLTEQVVRRWRDQLEVEAKPEEREVMATNVRLYFDLLARDPKLAFARNQAMVGRARVPLSSVPVESLAIERLVSEVENEGLDLTLAHILGGAAGPLHSNERIRGAFTRKGWEGKVRQLLAEERSDEAETWVLGLSQTADRATREERRKKMRSRYFYQYIQEWQAFIDSLRIEEPTDSDAALASLQDLTRGVPPPYGRIFEAIATNTQIEDSDASKRKAGLVKVVEEGVVAKVRKKMGVGMTKVADQALPPAKRVRADQDLGPENVRLAFADLVSFGVPPARPAGEGKDAPPPPATLVPLTIYQEQLAFVRDALVTYRESPEEHTAPLMTRLQEARTRVRALIEAGRVGWRPRLQALLWPPIEGATATSSTSVAKGKGQKWCTDVVSPFHRTLASRYPFNPTGHDAAVADVAEFFRPSAGTLWGFFEKALRSDIARTGDKFRFSTKLGREPKFQDRLLPYLEKAQEVSTVLFPPNGKDISTSLEVRIRPTPEISQTTLTIDGQVIEYHNGPEQWVMVSWPAQGKVRGASLRVRGRSGLDETIQQDGEWGLFRLLEQGTISGDPTSRTFNVVWYLRTHNMNITVSIRPARSETPFFGQPRPGTPLRLLAPFRSPDVLPPNTITANSPACPTPR